MNETKPTQSPPSDEALTEGMGESAPTEPIPETPPVSVEAAESAPQETPPELEAATGNAVGATWHNGKKITALWSINQSRNSWVGVSGVGWRRLANNSDSAVVALTMLASHAKELQRTVNLKEDSGKITAMYVW